MSIINETLQNVNSASNEVCINPSNKSRVVSNREISTRSPQSFLIFIISLGIVMALAYIFYNSKINQYFFKTKSYFIQKTESLGSDFYVLRDKLQLNLKVEKNNNHALNNDYSTSIKTRYYNAMNLLNEGNAVEARKNLRIILKEDPNFAPAKQVISMLKSDFK